MRSVGTESHDLEAFNSALELGFFLVWMRRSSCIFPCMQFRSYFCPYLGMKLTSKNSQLCCKEKSCKLHASSFNFLKSYLFTANSSSYC